MRINKHKTYLLSGLLLACLAVCFYVVQWVFFPNPGSKTLKDYNLIIINIDALRPDHLGCYDYNRNTSPFIDSLAKNGIKFTRAMANSSFTRESVSVLFTGKLPSIGGCYGWEARPSPKAVAIGEFFKNAGYSTGFFSNSPVLKFPAFTRGFQEVKHLKHKRLSGNGPELSKCVYNFIKKCSGKKFMIYAHFLDPHAPYNPPMEFYTRFSKMPYPHPIKLYNEVRKNCQNLIKEGFGPGEKRFEDLVRRYDAEIAGVDYSVEILVKKLKDYGCLDSTLLVITSDHGEEFLEHDYVEHAWTLYNESLHIPLIFWAPGVLSPGIIHSLISTVDILPTLLELMEIPYHKKHFEGSALLKMNGGDYLFCSSDKPFIAELMIQRRNMLRTIIYRDWKYISAQKWLEPGERSSALKNTPLSKHLQINIWGPGVREELYHLTKDPGEKYPLQSPKKLFMFRKMMKDYMNLCRKKGLPPEKSGNKASKKNIKKIKSLGYL